MISFLFSIIFQKKHKTSFEDIKIGSIFTHSCDLDPYYSITKNCNPIVITIKNVDHNNKKCEYISNYSKENKEISFSDLLSNYRLQKS